TNANRVTLSQTTFSGLSCNANLSASPAYLQFYAPADAARGQRVIPDLTAFIPANNPRVFIGATLVLPNVISFNVRILPIGGNAWAGANQAYFVNDVVYFNGLTYQCIQTIPANSNISLFNAAYWTLAVNFQDVPV